MIACADGSGGAARWPILHWKVFGVQVAGWEVMGFMSARLSFRNLGGRYQMRAGSYYAGSTGGNEHDKIQQCLTPVGALQKLGWVAVQLAKQLLTI